MPQWLVALSRPRAAGLQASSPASSTADACLFGGHQYGRRRDHRQPLLIGSIATTARVSVRRDDVVPDQTFITGLVNWKAIHEAGSASGIRLAYEG